MITETLWSYRRASPSRREETPDRYSRTAQWTRNIFVGKQALGLLVLVSSMHCCTSTSNLSTRWSSGGLTRLFCGNPHLETCFPLRCFQRLSLPNVANQPCPWQDNWHTRGLSVPVLSYWGQPLSRFLRAQRIGTELSHDVLNPARVPL